MSWPLRLMDLFIVKWHIPAIVDATSVSTLSTMRAYNISFVFLISLCYAIIWFSILIYIPSIFFEICPIFLFSNSSSSKNFLNSYWMNNNNITSIYYTCSINIWEQRRKQIESVRQRKHSGDNPSSKNYNYTR